jgi:hypothetical protein
MVKIKMAYKNQANFARSCGKSDSWISRIIGGRQDPTDEEKGLICRKLGVNLEEQLFEDINV